MPDSAIGTLWIDLLGQMAGGVAHEVNNALNGVAVNLAVVQIRLQAVPPAPADRVLPFADLATTQLGDATRLVHSVVAMARPVPTPVEPSSVLGQVLPVLVALTRQRGGAIGMVESDGTAVTGIDGDVVRLALCAALMGVGSHQGRVTIERRDGATAIRIEGASLPEPVAAAVERAGVALQRGKDEVTLTFSRVANPT